MMPQRASRRRILSIRACMVDLLSVRGRVVNGGEAGATPALPLGRRRTDADLTERPSGALEGRGGAAPASPPARGRGPFRCYACDASGAPERPSRTASNSLDVAELLEALSDLRFFLVGVGGVLGGLGRGRRGGFGTVFSHAGLFLPGRPRRRRARPRSGPGAAGGRGR